MRRDEGRKNTIEVYEGDLSKGKWDFSPLTRSMTKYVTLFRKETIDLGRQLQGVELQSQERVKKLAGTVGWGIAGAAFLGPAGAVAGMVFGGRKKKVLFTAHLEDGREFVAVTDGDTWKVLTAIAGK